MTNRRATLIFGLLVLAAVPTIAALVLAGRGGDTGDVVVLAPSSLAAVQTDLDAGLAERGLPTVEWVFGGSPSLVAQLVDGAPADVLLTADEATFEQARNAGVTWSTETTFATNVLVLAVADDNPGGVADLSDLTDPDLLIGVCAPEVPCGRLAATATAGLGVAVAADTEEPNVRALTTKLVAGELDAGLVYRTDAQATRLRVIDVDGLANFETTYVGTADEAGAPVLEFLTSDAGQAILAEAGFGR